MRIDPPRRNITAFMVSGAFLLIAVAVVLAAIYALGMAASG